MQGWPDGCIDHCIVDPPFNIASGSGRKGKNGLGWAFSTHVTMAEQWDTFTKVVSSICLTRSFVRPRNRLRSKRCQSRLTSAINTTTV